MIGALIIGAIVILGGIAFFMYGSSGSTTTNNTTTVLPGDTSGGAVTNTTYSSTTTTTTTAGVPVGSTKAATDITSTMAKLHATVSASGAPTTYWFEYSADPLLGAVLNHSTVHVAIVAAADQAPVFADVSGLSTSTKYYFRIVTQNSAGLVRGDTVTFNTK